MNDSRTPQNNIGMSIPDDESMRVKIQGHEIVWGDKESEDGEAPESGWVDRPKVEEAKIGFDEDGTPYRKLPDANDHAADGGWLSMIRKDVDMAEDGIEAILQDAGYQASTARFQHIPDPAPIEPAAPMTTNQRFEAIERRQGQAEAFYQNRINILEATQTRTDLEIADLYNRLNVLEVAAATPVVRFAWWAKIIQFFNKGIVR